jgi:hypothetical protein
MKERGARNRRAVAVCKKSSAFTGKRQLGLKAKKGEKEGQGGRRAAGF